MSGRVLVVDDDEDQCFLLKAQVARLGYVCEATTSAFEALERVAADEFEVVVTDLAMTEMDGVALCTQLVAVRPSVRVIVVTGQGSIDTAVAAIRATACDFLQKPVDINVLGLSIELALRSSRLRTEIRRAQLAEVGAGTSLARMIGESSAICKISEVVSRVATSDVSVMIHGETGTGKELVARALHAQSRRQAGPFVAINCAALSPSLLESELFGHARGAFTDARTAREGLFVAASGGTLFLDEIGDMPLEMQVKLLRAIQERTVRPIGANADVPFDVRLISATHRDLEADIRSQRFRQDLFFRINVVRVDVPPLRARGSDILELAAHFLQAATRAGAPVLALSALVVERLLAYDWPGNVRELENCMACAAALAQGDEVTLADLPERLRGFAVVPALGSHIRRDDIISIAEMERRHIVKVLVALDGNKLRAADVLGLDRRTLYRKLERYAEPESVGALVSADL